MVVSRAMLRKASTDSPYNSSSMVQPRDEEEAMQHRALLIPTDTPTEQEQVRAPRTAETDDLFSDPADEEQQDSE